MTSVSLIPVSRAVLVFEVEHAAQIALVDLWEERGILIDKSTAYRWVWKSGSNDFARTLTPVLAAMRRDENMTLRAIAAGLNAQGIRTRRDGRWHVSNVRNLLARLDHRNSPQRD